MKVVIDIDEELYENLKNGTIIISGIRTYRSVINLGLQAIANGIPLPKGHGNIYDERDLEKLGNVYFQEEVITNDSNLEFHFPKLIINATPIIESDKERANEDSN